MRKIVFDIETSNVFYDVGKADPTLLDISVVAIYDSETDKFSAYEVEELGELWPILEQADMLIGFNSDHFDIPLLNKYYPGDLSGIKSLDLLKEVRESLGRRIKLDTIAEATLGRQKTSDGLAATRMWAEGKKQEVKDYCVEDVRITRDIYNYARKHGSLKYTDQGKKRTIKLDTSNWEEKEDSAMTQTMPF